MRADLSHMRSKVSEVESQLLDLKVFCNGKVSGEQVRDIVDKKLTILQEYRRDAD